jgi:hypothetical protein
MRAAKTSDRAPVALMKPIMMKKMREPTLNWFLIDLEIPVREMAELAIANWMAAQSFGADQNDRRDLAILADQLLERARKTQECRTIASRCAASA